MTEANHRGSIFTQYTDPCIFVATVFMMSHKDKSNRCQSVSLDMLSNLPGVVIDDILGRLTLRDAVRSSILSKKWRYNWCRLPELTLDQALWKTITDLLYPSVNFGKVIDSILSLHAGPIMKFTLCIPLLERCPEIDNLIYFLSRNGIQHLVLRIPFEVNPYILPSSLFTCLQLRHLTLQHCLFRPPPAFKGFDCLTSLDLYDARIHPKYLATLISNCPLLEELVLKIIDILSDVIEINSPKLQCLEFSGMLRSVCLKNVPLLAKLSLTNTGILRGEGNCDIAKFFESCASLEHLYLDYCSFQFFTAGAGEVPRKPPFNLVCVKHLCLSKICLGCLNDVSFVLCLIRSFPYLQYMETKVLNNDGDISALECLEVEGSSDVTFSHLREVKIKGDLRTKHGLLLIKLILAKSPVLVKMLIEPYRYEEESVPVEIPAELSEFQRASPEVEVVCNMILFDIFEYLKTMNFG